MKRTILAVHDERNMHAVVRMGAAEISPMNLTRIGAAERPHTEVRAAVWRNREVAPWAAGKGK